MIGTTTIKFLDLGQYFVNTLYAVVDLQNFSIKQNSVKVEVVNYGQYSEIQIAAFGIIM